MKKTMTHPIHTLLSLIFFLFFVASASAQISELDAEGSLILSDVDYSFSLDESDPQVTIFDLRSNVVENVWSTESPLEGDGLLLIPFTCNGHVDLSAAHEQFLNRRVEIRLWFQPRGTDLSASVEWLLNNDEQKKRFALSLQPTGRMTSDGWREMSTGPIDFDAASLPDSRIWLQENSLRPGNDLSLFSVSPSARVAVDAISITDIGPRQFNATSCDVISRESMCGEEGACVWGLCVDGVIVNGNPPLTKERRRLALEARQFLYETFHGERSRFDVLDAFGEDLAQIVERPRAAFYPELRAAITRHKFGHGIGPLADGTWEHSNSGLCVAPAIADLLPDGPQLPIVSWIASENEAFSELEIGDALIEIDGLPVEDWIDLTRQFTTPSHADLLSINTSVQGHIIWRAAHHGSVLTFARCGRLDGTPCDAAELTTQQVELAPLMQSLALGDTPPADYGGCDMRFSRLESAPPDGGNQQLVLTETDEGGVVTMMHNGFVPDDQAQWLSDAEPTNDPDATGVILDQRMGRGGSYLFARRFTSRFLAPEENLWLFHLSNGEITADIVEMILDCNETFPHGGPLPDCEFHWWALGPSISSGVANTMQDKPLVVMMGFSASMNEITVDWLRARSAPLFVLGLDESIGARSYIKFSQPLDGEVRGAGFQLYDSFYAETKEALAPDPVFISGSGVVPDETCLQTQSDAVAGVDTCMSRAREWLLQQ